MLTSCSSAPSCGASTHRLWKNHVCVLCLYPLSATLSASSPRQALRTASKLTVLHASALRVYLPRQKHNRPSPAADNSITRSPSLLKALCVPRKHLCKHLERAGLSLSRKAQLLPCSNQHHRRRRISCFWSDICSPHFLPSPSGLVLSQTSHSTQGLCSTIDIYSRFCYYAWTPRTTALVA